MRIYGFLSILGAAAGCAGGGTKIEPPAPAATRTAAVVAAPSSSTWEAVIDVFAERNIPIRTMERASGFIATEQLGVDERESLQWADCGRSITPLKWRRDKDGKKVEVKEFPPNRAIYNVLVRGDNTRSTVKVTVRWTYMGMYRGSTECTTKGIWEGEAESEIKRRAEGVSTPATPTRVAPSEVAPPARAADDVPPGMNWIASTRTKIYYPVGCAEVARVPPADRVFYQTESALQAAGFTRGPGC
jgi:hypothetical protein